MVLTARALIQAVDHQLMRVKTGAQALAHSEALTRGDLASFHRLAREFREQADFDFSVALLDREGRQLLNTAVDYGQPLNTPANPISVESVFEAGEVSISDLFIGPVVKRPIISVAAPVVRSGKVIYAVSIRLPTDQFRHILKTQNLPSEWLAGILDRNGVFVARTHQPEKYVGQRASPTLLRQLDVLIEGAGSTVTPEGIEVTAFHSRSLDTSWAVAIGIPHTVLRERLLNISAILTVAMTLLLMVGFLLATALGKRIGDAFRSLSTLAFDLGAGQTLKPVEFPIAEANDVASMMARAATLLEERDATRKASEARFMALANNMAQLAWMTDAEGQILWFNRRWYEYTGANQQDLVDSQWLRHLHPEHTAQAKAEFLRHAQSGEPWEATFAIQGRDGIYRWFLTSALPLRDAHGEVINWFGTSTDVTPQLQANQLLEESHVRKDEFISILAHELRNPLAPVRTAVELLKRVDSEDPRITRAQAVIERQVAHMARLIDDLLDVARIANGKLALTQSPCDLALIARHTAEDYQLNMDTAGLHLTIYTPETPLPVFGDAVRLAQMIGNLLNNAIRFTERGGHIDVRAEADLEHGQALVRVTDTGIGIPDELMQRLFDPFSQAAQDLARSKGGLGLGLALTKGLVELHGGSLSVDSAGMGLGATFTLRLPLDTAVHEVAPPPPLSCVVKTRRVLVIEDNVDAARTLGEILELSGHEVALAFDGEAGLETANRFSPEVIISDIGLPGKTDGYAVAQRLRSIERFNDVVLIALSGYADEQSRECARISGFDYYLFKPVSLSELENLLSEDPV